MPKKSRELSRRKSFTRRIWLTTAALAVLAAGVTVIYLNSRVTVPYFSWAKAQGWDVRPVRVVRLKPKWLARIERVPSSLSRQDYAILRACWSTPLDGPPYYDDGAVSTLALRHLFEQNIALYPHSFLPKHCLALWYKEHHNQPLYQAWEQQALHEAPTVLAGRVVDDNGRPVANATLQLDIETLDPNDLRASSPVADEREVTTDEEGCYYVPVFKGVYNPDALGLLHDVLTDAQGRHLNAYVTGGETLDEAAGLPSGQLSLGMITTSHVGILPKIIARPKIQILSPFGQMMGSIEHPITIKGNVLHLAWKPVPGAVQYCIQMTQVEPEHGYEQQIFPDNPYYGTAAQIPLNGMDPYEQNAPLLNRNDVIRLTICAYGPKSPLDLVDISDEYEFRPADAVAPLALTNANFARVIGPGAVVFAIQVVRKQIVVTGSAPSATLNHGLVPDMEIERFFGLQISGWQNSEPNAEDRQTFRITLTR